MRLYLRKKETGHAGGRAVSVLGVGFGRAGRGGLGRAPGLALVGALGLFMDWAAKKGLFDLINLLALFGVYADIISYW